KKKKNNKSTELNDENLNSQPTLKQPIHKQKQITKKTNTKSLLNINIQKQVDEILQQEKEKQKILEQEKEYLNINFQV
ncbi:hypothetical protein K6L59_03355, partial [Candidatus Phytoplasma sp. Tabriz.2]|nr:hypothetical protein [Candidatus Phytoplasma australiense]